MPHLDACIVLGRILYRHLPPRGPYARPKKEGTRGLVGGSGRGNALLARNDQKAVEA